VYFLIEEDSNVYIVDLLYISLIVGITLAKMFIIYLQIYYFSFKE